MSASKNINRKAFLTSTITGITALAFGGCGDEADDSSSSSGGASTGGSSGGSSSTGGRSSGGASTGGNTGGGGVSSGGVSSGGASSGGASSGGSPGDGGASGGLGGVQDMGGAGGDEGYMCTTNTDNGNHSHPLTVPGGDVDRGYQLEPYLLEDGGTGHTHRLLLSAYDFLYLAAGATVELDSSEDNGHQHRCVISCSPS